MASEPKWLTVGQVAQILGVSTETVRNKIKRGELPATTRASNARRAAWLIDAAEFERQRAADVELAAVRQRLGGVVTSYGEQFFENVEQQHPGVTVDIPGAPTLAEHLRGRSAEHDLFERLQAEMATNIGFRQSLDELDEADRIEAEAQELARLYRRDRAVHDRFREILDEEGD
jgi:hypothetical protein